MSDDSGGSQGDLITNNGSLTVSGVVDGATVQYSTDGGITWSTTPPQFTSDGTHTVLVRQFEFPGRESGSSSLTFTLDTTAPTGNVAITALGSPSNVSFTRANASADFFTNSPVLTVFGTNDPLDSGERVQISRDGGNTWVDVTQVDDTHWTYVDPITHTTSFTYQVRVLDAAGQRRRHRELRNHV